MTNVENVLSSSSKKKKKKKVFLVHSLITHLGCCTEEVKKKNKACVVSCRFSQTSAADGDEAIENGDLDVVEGLLDLAAARKCIVATTSHVGGRKSHTSAALTMKPNKSLTLMVPSGGVSKLPQLTRPKLQRSPFVVLMKVV